MRKLINKLFLRLGYVPAVNPIALLEINVQKAEAVLLRQVYTTGPGGPPSLHAYNQARAELLSAASEYIHLQEFSQLIGEGYKTNELSLVVVKRK